MVFKVSTPGSAKYGIVLEFSQSGDVYLKTLYKGTDNSIEESVKKRGAAGRFLPDGKSAIPSSHPLSIFSVQQALGLVKTKTQYSIRQKSHAQDLGIAGINNQYKTELEKAYAEGANNNKIAAIMNAYQQALSEYMQNATLGKLKIPKVTRLKKNTIPNLIKMK